MEENARAQLLLEKATVANVTSIGGRIDPPARFLIVLPNGDRGELLTRLDRLFQNEPLVLDVFDEERFVLTFSARTFPLVDFDSASLASHEFSDLLADALGALAVQPDLPRGGVPVKADPKPGIESVDDFPLGCWVAEEPALNENPRWALDAIKVRAAWQLSSQMGRPGMGRGIIIAQPDTGITDHRQLSGVRLAGAFNTLGDGPADNATDPLTQGFGLNPGHGTGTASVVVSPDHDAADMVVGSAPLASHLPIRALRSVWLHEELPIASAVDLAVEKGAHVITMSLGGVALPFSPLRAAIRRAVAKNVIVMAAAGNCVGTVVYPARFSECLAVAGTNSQGGKWPGSCSGLSVDISAPAQNVLRAFAKPDTNGSTGQGQGTSFAVALTAGVAACWLAHHGRDQLIVEAKKRGETLQTMFRRLVRATSQRPAGWNSTAMGAGIVDAEALFKASLDLGLGTESPAFEAEARSPAEEMRVFLTELLGEDPGMSDDQLIRHGTELAAALLSLKLDPSSPPTVSPNLAALLRGAAASGLARALGQPVAKIVDADALAAQAGRIKRLRQTLAFGKAITEGVSAESASAGQASGLPEPDALSSVLDRLLQHADPDRDARQRADFERAIDLIRTHGTSGVGKLHDPTALLGTDELAAVEAVVKADGSRPSLLVRDSAVDETHPLVGGWGVKLAALRKQIRTRSALCGRIQPTGGHASRYCGTGILVDPAGPWVLSNFHVLQQALQSYPIQVAKSDRGLRIISGLEIDFVAETGSVKTNRWTIEEAVFPKNAGEGFGYIDAVLLRINRSLDGGVLPGKGSPAGSDKIRFSNDGAFTNGELPLLGVIGFPYRPPLTTGVKDGIDWGWVVGELFGGRFGVKRFAPGEFYRSIGTEPQDAETRYAFGHDPTTLRGSSGSIVFSLTAPDCPAFGLHFAGFDNESNYALTTESLRRGFEASGVPFP